MQSIFSRYLNMSAKLVINDIGDNGVETGMLLEEDDKYILHYIDI